MKDLLILTKKQNVIVFIILFIFFMFWTTETHTLTMMSFSLCMTIWWGFCINIALYILMLFIAGIFVIFVDLIKQFKHYIAWLKSKVE